MLAVEVENLKMGEAAVTASADGARQGLGPAAERVAVAASHQRRFDLRVSLRMKASGKRDEDVRGAEVRLHGVGVEVLLRRIWVF